MKQRNWFRPAADGGRVLRRGAQSGALTAAAIALAVLVNLAVGALPEKYTRFDLSESGIYTLTDTTKEILSGLEQDVTLYYMVQKGTEDPVVVRLLERYLETSDRISVVYKDPAVYPAFAAQHGADTAAEGSILLEIGEESVVLDANDFYPMDMNSYYTTGMYDVRFDGENLITAGIYQLTAGEASRAYYLTNHSEYAFGSALQSAVEKQNVQLEPLSLLTGTIPEDCDLLIINCPQTDLGGAADAVDEITQLEQYLAKGGSLLVLTDTYYETPNLDRLMAAYGMDRMDGLVLEGDSNYHTAMSLSGYRGELCLLPMLNELGEDTVTEGLSGADYYLLPLAHGIMINEEAVPDTVTVQSLLTTSDSAYNKAEGYNMETAEQAAEDYTGSMNLGVWAQDTATGAQIVWLGSGAVADEYFDSVVGGNNSKLLVAFCAALSGQESTTLVGAKALEGDTVTPSASTVALLGALFVLVIPVGLLAAGAVVVIRRRR